MGRSGGGGGGRPSGGFSGGRGGGGRSAGRPAPAGGPGRGPGGGPRGGGPGGPGGRRGGGPGPHHPHRHWFGGGGFWGRPFFGGWHGGGCGGGCLGGALGIIVVLMLVVMLFGSLLTSCVGGPNPFGSGGVSSDAAEASETVRERLSSDDVTLTAYYTDADGTWIQSASTLEEGLEEFYERTGVQPYVYILPNGEITSADELAEKAVELYDELFSDEGHFLLVFCDDDEGSYIWAYAVGETASSVMDSEAIAILADELDETYYDYDLTEEEIFSQAFSETAERIMSAAEGQTRSRVAGALAVGGVVIAVIVVTLVMRARRRQQQEEEHERRVEDILNTPYERYSDKDVEDLADKYDD